MIARDRNTPHQHLMDCPGSKYFTSNWPKERGKISDWQWRSFNQFEHLLDESWPIKNLKFDSSIILYCTMTITARNISTYKLIQSFKYHNHWLKIYIYHCTDLNSLESHAASQEYRSKTERNIHLSDHTAQSMRYVRTTRYSTLTSDPPSLNLSWTKISALQWKITF